MLSQVRFGALELATFPGTVMSTLIPVTSVTDVGFAFTSYDQVWAAMDGEVGNHIRRSIEKFKRQPFDTVWDNGFRQITTSVKPIKTPQHSCLQSVATRHVRHVRPSVTGNDDDGCRHAL